MKRTVGFQGELGAFSQVAASQLAPGHTPIPFGSFDQVFEAAANGKVSAAVIPIENTLHGSVHENYDHLLKYNLPIHGETFVRIVHNLIVPPKVKRSQIRRVYSHPVALNQCRHFFENNPGFEKTSFYDTAGSVKMLMEQDLQDAGAIASATAAEIYGARILEKSIEDDRQNYTRFFLLNKPSSKRSGKRIPEIRYKTSVVFTTRNIPGALFRALSAFALRDLNLTKIESRPLRGTPWDYLFYVDFIGHTDDQVTGYALGHLAEVADMWRVLGCYPAAGIQ
jgi:prephenate dehydratase